MAFPTSFLSYNAQTFQTNAAQRTACLHQQQHVYLQRLSQRRHDANDYAAFPLAILKAHAGVCAIFAGICVGMLGADAGRGGFEGGGLYSDRRFSETLVLFGFYGNLVVGAGGSVMGLLCALWGVVEVIGVRSAVRLQRERLAKGTTNINFLCKGFLLEIRRSVFRRRAGGGGGGGNSFLIDNYTKVDICGTFCYTSELVAG